MVGELESGDNGHLSFGKLPPLRYSFICTLIPPSTSGCLFISHIFDILLANCLRSLLRSWSHNTNTSPLRCPYRLSPVHPDPHDPANGIPSFIDSRKKFCHRLILSTNSPPYQALSSNINSLPLAAGRPLTYIDRLFVCAQLCRYSVILLSQSSRSVQIASKHIYFHQERHHATHLPIQLGLPTSIFLSMHSPTFSPIR